VDGFLTLEVFVKNLIDAPTLVFYYALNTGKEVIVIYEFLSQ
jgi:hypothetical protein